jgi:hypothetical protein
LHPLFSPSFPPSIPSSSSLPPSQCVFLIIFVGFFERKLALFFTFFLGGWFFYTTTKRKIFPIFFIKNGWSQSDENSPKNWNKINCFLIHPYGFFSFLISQFSGVASKVVVID